VRVIQRADELAEFVATYWKHGKQLPSAQVKKGTCRGAREVRRLPAHEGRPCGGVRRPLSLPRASLEVTQEVLWMQLAEGTLSAPSTREGAPFCR
jgi:60 kDa SS-A/Ro ribonucleoprotein